MRRLLLSSALFLVFASAPLLAAGALDGKTFTVEIARRGTKTKTRPDELVFADGKFRSSAHDKLGFGETLYTSAPSGAKTAFDATAKSAKQGVMTWKGTVDGDAISGEMTWNRTRRTPVRYWFKGSAKK
jgi:hypothetical protein